MRSDTDNTSLDTATNRFSNIVQWLSHHVNALRIWVRIGSADDHPVNALFSTAGSMSMKGLFIKVPHRSTANRRLFDQLLQRAAVALAGDGEGAVFDEAVVVAQVGDVFAGGALAEGVALSSRSFCLTTSASASSAVVYRPPCSGSQ